MIAIYARQSVDRADSISIESQIAFCRHEAGEEALQTYIDRGYSGKNTERPGFQSMMADMERGLISKVIVYKLDRISRSILDFSTMMERFEACHVEFLSTTEKFDTSSPMGRAMLNICVVFAQLERETIQKRVADAYLARSRKSLYMGGRVPYGFRLKPAVIGQIRSAMYTVCREEAEQVRLIYTLYARPSCSLGDIVKSLQERGATRNGKPWGRTRLAELLRNPVYVRADLSIYEYYRERGAGLVNDPSDFIGTNGCYYYRGRPGAEQDCLVLAPHEGVIPADLWLACREKCSDARQVRPCQKAKNTWLAGKVKCALCGYALVDKRYPNRKARYFFCSNRMNAKACPGPGTIYSDDVEEIVYEELRNRLAQFPCLRGRRAGGGDPQLAPLRLELAQARREIDALLDRLSSADDVMYRYISGRVEALDEKKQELERRIAGAARRAGGGRGELHGYLSSWTALSFEDKRRAVDLLVRVIHASGELVRIEWRI